MNRREVLKTIALLGAGAVFTTRGPLEMLTQTGAARAAAQGATPPDPGAGSGRADLVAVMGGEPAEMLEKALPEVGGISAYVKKGNSVVIKPNIGWSLPPELAANTNPDLVAALIRACFAAGAADVLLFDHTCDEWGGCYKNSRMEETAKATGAKLIPAHEESYFRDVSLPRGRVLKEAKVHKAILDCDVWFNVPVLKHHGGANLTIAMKNYMGLVWDRRFFHRNNLQQCIADICTLDKRPALNIVDAYRVVKSNGPRTNSATDVVTPKALFISGDIVAVDTVSTRFFSQIREMPLDNVAYLAGGEALKLGTTNIESLNIKRIKI